MRDLLTQRSLGRPLRSIRLKVDIGQRFGRWVVIAHDRTVPTAAVPSGRPGALCECDCGTRRVVAVGNLLRASRSCGCLHREIVSATNKKIKATQNRTHGLSYTYLYTTWRCMMRRCYDSQLHSYSYYGGRGINVDKSWHDVAAFADYVRRELGNRPTGYTLDRIDNDGNYEPGNVRWASRVVQRHNSRQPQKRMT